MIKDVVKRDGSVEPFSEEKLLKYIKSKTLDYNVDVALLLEQINALGLDRIATVEIRDHLLDMCLKLFSIGDIGHLDYRHAARNLYLDIMRKRYALHKNISADNIYITPISDLIRANAAKGVYSEVLAKLADNASLDSWAASMINPERDFLWDYAGIKALNGRYLKKLDNELIELPQQLFFILSCLIAYYLKDFTYAKINLIYDAISLKKLSLATPILSNLRTPGASLSSCFITQMKDSLENIYATLTDGARVSKNGGGLGIHLSKVRGKNSPVSGADGASGGVVPWIRLINDTGVAVNQKGLRSGALTPALDVWHIDIEAFLELQTENGDPRQKAYDIFPQVVFPDLFMRRVEANQEWSLFCPYILKSFGIDLSDVHTAKFQIDYEAAEANPLIRRKTVKAKDLFITFLKVAVETGMPYAFFKDTVNSVNPNRNQGVIYCANLCQESYSNFGEVSKAGEHAHDPIHVCNLLSLVLPNILDEELPEMTALAVEILEGLLEATVPPVSQAYDHNNFYRIIGVGIMGLADWLVARKLLYSNCLKEVGSMMEIIAYNALLTSCKFAIAKGAAPASELSLWKQGIVYGGKDLDWFYNNPDKFSLPLSQWADLIDMLKEHGVRHTGLLAVAPNTSTSILMGVTASYLPVFKQFYFDAGSQGTVPIVPPLLSEQTRWYYQENPRIDQQHIISVTAALQQWVDQGLSMELYINLNDPNFTAVELYQLYMTAWKKKCKTVYYVRSEAKNFDDKGCTACAN